MTAVVTFMVQATSTVTFVGLVSASKTAERFCDWATRASMSAGEASASIEKVTLMSLKPLRTSASAPRMPRMSWPPSTEASTELSLMPRFCATEAMPAVRQDGQAHEQVLDRGDAVVLGGEDGGVVGLEDRLVLVALLLAEAEELLDLGGAVDAVLPLRAGAPGELGRLGRALENFAGVQQRLDVHSVRS